MANKKKNDINLKDYILFLAIPIIGISICAYLFAVIVTSITTNPIALVAVAVIAVLLVMFPIIKLYYKVNPFYDETNLSNTDNKQ